MCGIVGYIGTKEPQDIIINGLKKLEYRGYDSAGIAVVNHGKIELRKHVGAISNLEKLIGEERLGGHVGIGHTRWATHGAPSDLNSHPHMDMDGTIAVVHNGTVENYVELKAELEKEGVVFRTETDTEVATMLISKYYHRNHDLKKALDQAISEMRGTYAIAVVAKDQPDQFVAYRKNAPLIVGVGNNCNFVASDFSALLAYTKDVYLLENGDTVVLTKDAVNIYDEEDRLIERPMMHVDWDVSAAEKGGYEHFMLKEIHEQPNAVKTTITPRIVNGMPDLSECGLTLEALKNYRKLFIVACGTAMHAGMVGKYVIEKLARTEVTVDIASEFRYRDPIITPEDLVIVVSQSGETADTKAALHLAHERGAKVLSVVNVKGSSIARESDMVLYTHAGPEISVASTKAFSVQMSVMYLLAFEMAYAKGHIDENECKRLTAKLAEIPDIIEKTMECEKKCKYVSSKLITAQSLLYIGRGLDYALSMEGSLKLKEISYIHSESYAAGELKHGTISLVEDGMPVIGVATQTELLEKTVSNIVEVKSRGAFTIAVCKEGTEFSEGVIDEAIEVPAMEDVLMPMLTVIPLQLIAYYTTVLKGLNVDKPRNLAKSVTVE